jgi:hypothetical protein
MSWYGIRYRRHAEETDHLAKLDRFTPRVLSGGSTVSLLDFSASPVKPGDTDLEIVARLSLLEELDLTGAPVTDAGLVHLEKLTCLRHIDLRQTPVTDAGVKRLQRALPEATIYH